MSKHRGPKKIDPGKIDSGKPAAGKSDIGMVRIIAGQYRSRRLPVVSVDGLRPTGDRVRETLFNWLQNDVSGARCLDAYAGTGALGFEAASRFAKSVTLVELNRTAAQALIQSQELLGAESVEVVNQSFDDYAASGPEPFDIVFIDPPFVGTHYGAVLQSVQSIVAPGGLVYVESPKTLRDADAIIPAHWHLRRDKQFGDVRARLFGL